MPWREEIKREPIVELDTPITQGGQRNNSLGRAWIPNIDMETSVDIPPGCYYPPLDEIDRARVLPRPVERALVVVLKELGKPDYSVSGVHPPILLLNTLGKILEAVRARCLLFWVKAYKLLLDTRFGGRPGRNTEQVLLALTNAIDREWLRSKIITLIVFDLKGALSGVRKVSLDARLRAKGIPMMARRWIYICMENRFANVIFDDFKQKFIHWKIQALRKVSP